MPCLLDTNTLIFALIDSPRLPRSWQERILGDDEVFVSAASIWEIAIKNSLKRLDFDIDPKIAITDTTAMGCTLLNITPELTIRVATLPWHHRDPFDRLIIAQAKVLDIEVMTTDRRFQDYDVKLFSS